MSFTPKNKPVMQIEHYIKSLKNYSEKISELENSMEFALRKPVVITVS
jgi:hypothetical protein